MQMLAGGMNNSDKKVVEEVEKSGRGGAKEE